jgi:hypothetical protein
MAADTYIKKMLANYSKLFELSSKGYSSPMAKGDHPLLNLSP